MIDPANLLQYVQYGVFLALVTLLVRPVGAYLARVFAGERTPLDPLCRPIERGLYRLTGVDPRAEMDWRGYAGAFVAFGLVGALFLFVLLLLQSRLPWYDAAALPTPLTWHLALNTAISFATTTTWQAYGGETAMSYLTQMLGLAAQNFLAGAAGLAIGIAFIRSLAREQTDALGNFWVDLTRAILYVLLPLCLVTSVLLVWQGVPMNWSAYVGATGLEGGAQTIAQGPVAALESIKNFGSNGGGFFNVNAAHPYENPTPLTNLIELLAIAVLPAALTYTFGRMIGRQREGWLLYIVMATLFAVGLLVVGWAETRGTPTLATVTAPATVALAGNPGGGNPGGNMEGKETRFGIGGSALAVVTTSNGATGSYNAMHDSLTPIGGLVALVNMLLGEITFGGLGTGLSSLILVALLGLFLTGLMVGRTPEYLGKRIGPEETTIIVVYTLLAPLTILFLTGVAVSAPAGLAGLITNDGPHGFTGILYAYTSAVANNGQNFAGVSANSPFYNLTIALAMLVGRFGLGVVALALAGALVRQPRRQPTLGTLPTDTPLFAVVVLGTALIVGALSFFPALALGPIVEQLLLAARY